MNGKISIARFATRYHRSSDSRSAGFISAAHALGINKVKDILCSDIYFIQGDLSEEQQNLLAETLLSDPVTQQVEFSVLSPNQTRSVSHQNIIEVALRAGVTDPVAEQILRAARQMNITNITNASTGQQFVIQGDEIHITDLELLARRLLVNDVIQRYVIGEIDPVFPEPAAASNEVKTIPLRAMDNAGLLNCSQENRAALDLSEMRAIQAYFINENRDPTDIEFEMIAQTWSEHCIHKTFRAQVDTGANQNSVYPPQINSILKSYIRRATEEINAPWVISAFEDNAGIIEFDDTHEVSFKVETHNHPSAIEPFGGANTGLGGVIRDILGVSAKPIAGTDVLCFGMQDAPLESLPAGVLHPQRVQHGVVAGIQDYGNKMGIPTVNGAVWYDPAYTSNPLVYCGCVGLAPRNMHRRTAEPQDHIILLGGRTGRDGLRGATFSSMTMDAQTGEVSGASVQIGAPITEKGVMEVILRARDQRLYHAITDCGAGGLSSAIGEMGSRTGVRVELSRVCLKYPGLAPWEIWLSEAQERMVLAVPPENISQVQALCDLFDVDLTDLGDFGGNGRIKVTYDQHLILDLDAHFLHHGIPQRKLKAAPAVNKPSGHAQSVLPDLATGLLTLLAHPNIASKESVVRIYDHEVQGGTCVKPLSGPGDGPSDACVIKPAGTKGFTGIVLSNGFNPEYGKIDPYRMALYSIDEAIRNAVAVGADPDRLAILDNFCWGDPLRPENMWALLEAARGCYEAAVTHRSPFISGKDSFNNEYLTTDGTRQSIPPSLLISAMGIIPDVRKAVTMSLKQPGNALYLAGQFNPVFGGSHFSRCFEVNSDLNPAVPLPSSDAPAFYRALHHCMRTSDLVRACHDLSEGGLAVAAAEMSIASNLGLDISLPSEIDVLPSLFGETANCLLIEIQQGDEAHFEKQMSAFHFRQIARVTSQPVFSIRQQGQPVISLPIQNLARAWKSQLS